MQETIIGQYKIIDEIGHGGMGIVYLGEQVSLKRQVAIKTLPLELAHDQEYLQRIENEAKIMAKFSHPNIVYIHDRVVHDDAVYLIMEYVPGITVTDRLNNDGPYKLDEAARIIIRVAVALEHAHSKGIIHRDIKPSNIMIRRNHVVKVTDFGIAKSTEGSDVTRIRFTPGTRNYMSPEQARGIRDIDGRSDIYSLGVVFYQMITGKIPPYPVPDRLPFVPPRYERIILKCLMEDRSERYQTAKDLVDALDKAKEETRRGKASRTAERSPKKKSTLVTLALSIILLVLLFVWQLDPIKKFVSVALTKNAMEDAQIPETKENEKHEDIIPSEESHDFIDEPSDTVSSGELDDELAVGLAPEDKYDEIIPLSLPTLRPAAERIDDIISQISNDQALNLKSNARDIFALKTGFFDSSGTNPELEFAIYALLDQMTMVRRVETGGCDLLISVDPTSQKVSFSSNLQGDDQVDKYQENQNFQDEEKLFTILENFIQRYYSFSILSALNLIKSTGDGFASQIMLNGESDGMIRAGDSIDICLSANQDAYAMLLSVNSEGIYMLFPQTRDEFTPLVFQNPFCTGPMQVSPPTGTEMIASILFAEKTLLPVDQYLAAEDQIIIEPASWSYDLYSSNNAIEFCERLFNSLHDIPPDQYAIQSKFIKTYE